MSVSQSPETPNELTTFQLDMINRFKHHPPKNDATVKAHETIREECLKMTSYIDKYVPNGREKSLAITHLEEVMFWCNSGIARS